MCNKCNQNNCGCPSTECGCKSKIPFSCTNYDGINLEPLGIIEGMDGNMVIKIINDYLEDLILEQTPVVIESVGNGAVIYKGLSNEFKHEIKTLVEGANVSIEETENSLTISAILPEQEATTIVNIGSGEGLYKSKNTVTGNHEFKKIKSSDNTVQITATTSEIDLKVTPQQPIDYPVIDGESIGNGEEVYGGLGNKKIKIKSLVEGEGIKLTSTEDEVTISLANTGTINTNYWYLNADYQRPIDWTPEEVLDGTPLPKGSSNDPFINYEEFLKKYIGNTGGTNVNGVFSKTNPRKGNVTLQVLSDISTSSDLEVNGLALKLNGGISFTYTGSREYAFDQKVLWDEMPRTGGIINRTIANSIEGEGVITRTDYLGTPKFGLFRMKASISETSPTSGVSFNFLPTGEGLIISEPNNPGIYTALTTHDGVTPLYNGNLPLLGTTQAPVTPLIHMDGTTYGYFLSSIIGSKLFIVTKSQKGIHCINGAKLSVYNDSLKYQISNSQLSYQKKMWREETFSGSGVFNYFPSGLTAEEREMVDFNALLGGEPHGLFFKPHDEYSMFTLENSSHIRIENMSTEANGFINAGANSIISLKTNSIFEHISSLKDTGGGTAVNFIKIQGNNNAVSIQNGQILSKYLNFVKGDGVSNLSMAFMNSTINSSKNIKKDIPVLTINTGGSLSVINYNPILTMNAFANEASAISAGLINGMLFRNSSTEVVTQINN